jgi:aminopeptidase N
MTDRWARWPPWSTPMRRWPTPRWQRFHAAAATRWSSTSGSCCRPRAPEPLGATASVRARAKASCSAPRLLAAQPEPRAQPAAQLCTGNPAAFHRADAAGYVFWAEQVLELDALNPQLAGRLARAMDRWAVLAEPYRSAAREAIARVAANARPVQRRARDRHPKALEDSS